MLSLFIRIALAIHLALITASAIAGPAASCVFLIDPLSPLAEIAQLEILLATAIVVHEAVEVAGPGCKRRMAGLAAPVEAVAAVALNKRRADDPGESRG